MTKRYPLRGTFRGGNAGDPGDFERAAFGVFQAANRAHYAGGHFDQGLGYSGAGGHLLGGDVNHVDFARFAVMGEFGHGL